MQRKVCHIGRLYQRSIWHKPFTRSVTPCAHTSLLTQLGSKGRIIGATLVPFVLWECRPPRQEGRSCQGKHNGSHVISAHESTLYGQVWTSRRRIWNVFGQTQSIRNSDGLKKAKVVSFPSCLEYRKGNMLNSRCFFPLHSTPIFEWYVDRHSSKTGFHSRHVNKLW